MTARSDQEWIRQLKQNDPQTIADLWEELFVFAYNAARQYSQSEDVAHEAAVAAYERVIKNGIYRYSYEGPFMAYCRVIVTREVLRVIDKLNKERQRLAENDGELPDDLPDTNASIESGISQYSAEMQAALKPCIEQCPVRDVQIMLAISLHKERPETVAQRFNIKRNNVSVIAHRTRKFMHDCLEKRGYHSPSDIL